MILARSNDCPYCGPGHSNSCYVQYSTGDHCYSCGSGSRKSAEHYLYRKLEAAKEKNLFIPDHTTSPKEFSPQCLKWLYTYYMYDESIIANNIAYCPPQADKPESLMFLLLDDKGLIRAYQRRFFPKAFFSSSEVRRSPYVVGGAALDEVVLVEDYISACRVAEACSSMCLFGTTLNKQNLDYLLENYSKITIWLDDDKPGIDAACKILAQLKTASLCYNTNRAFSTTSGGFTLRTIKNKQPKELSTYEIHKTLFS